MGSAFGYHISMAEIDIANVSAQLICYLSTHCLTDVAIIYLLSILSLNIFVYSAKINTAAFWQVYPGGAKEFLRMDTFMHERTLQCDVSYGSWFKYETLRVNLGYHYQVSVQDITSFEPLVQQKIAQ